MMSLNDNDKNIQFDFTGTQQRRYGDRHSFYTVTLPDGATVDDALAIVLANGFKTQQDAAWYEPYARIVQNSVIDMATGTVRPSNELIITEPYCD